MPRWETSFCFFSVPGYLLDLHSFPNDALPISCRGFPFSLFSCFTVSPFSGRNKRAVSAGLSVSELKAEMIVETRSEEHTSELQSHSELVCRLLLEKKNKQGSQDGKGHAAYARR